MAGQQGSNAAKKGSREVGFQRTPPRIHDIPTSSPAPAMHSPQSSQHEPAQPHEQYAVAHAAAQGRRLLFGRSVSELRQIAHLDPIPSTAQIAATFYYPPGTDTALLRTYLEHGQHVVETRTYRPAHFPSDTWDIRLDAAGVEVVAPTVENTDTGWQALQRAERALRGHWWNRSHLPAPRIELQYIIPVADSTVLERQTLSDGTGIEIMYQPNMPLPYLVQPTTATTDEHLSPVRFSDVDQAPRHADAWLADLKRR